MNQTYYSKMMNQWTKMMREREREGETDRLAKGMGIDQKTLRELEKNRED